MRWLNKINKPIGLSTIGFSCLITFITAMRARQGPLLQYKISLTLLGLSIVCAVAVCIGVFWPSRTKTPGALEPQDLSPLQPISPTDFAGQVRRRSSDILQQKQAHEMEERRRKAAEVKVRECEFKNALTRNFGGNITLIPRSGFVPMYATIFKADTWEFCLIERSSDSRFDWGLIAVNLKWEECKIRETLCEAQYDSVLFKSKFDTPKVSGLVADCIANFLADIEYYNIKSASAVSSSLEFFA